MKIKLTLTGVLPATNPGEQRLTVRQAALLEHLGATPAPDCTLAEASRLLRDIITERGFDSWRGDEPSWRDDDDPDPWRDADDDPWFGLEPW